jgi:predicted TIM-barrel fold metal-dependent hydrolase
VHPDLRDKCKTPPDQLLKRFYFDALTHSGQSVRHLIQLVGADRIVIGTDHPYDAGLDQPIAEIEEIPDLSNEERALITGKNALRLLGEDRW